MEINVNKRLRLLGSVLIGIAFCGAFIFFLVESSVRFDKEDASICDDCNIVLISVDSLRADHVGAYGYSRDTTPNFDALAEKSALFLNYFSPSTITTVTEASVQTGLYPSSNGVTNFDTPLPQDQLTLTKYLKDKNYTTSAVHTSPEFVYLRLPIFRDNPAMQASFLPGFDSYVFLNTVHGIYSNRDFPTSERLQSEFDVLHDKKFFLWLTVGGVHWPFGAFSNDTFNDPNYSGFFRDAILDWPVFRNIYERVAYPDMINLTDADIGYVVDKYDNGIRSFDDMLGTVVSELAKRNLLEKTIIVVESEHGEDLGERGYFSHYDVQDTVVHTPLLLYIPGLNGKKRVESFTGAVDIFPTLIELLGNPVPQFFQGRSLVPIINGKEADGSRQQIFMQHMPLWEEAVGSIRQRLEERGISSVSGIHGDIAIRTSEWKYILRTARERQELISWWATLTGKPLSVPEDELYNILNDPLEKKNVVNEYPEKAAELRAKLEDWFSKVSADTPTPVKRDPTIQPYF